MMSTDAPHLSRLLINAAARRPDGIAVEEESGRRATYAEIDRMADRIATRLTRWGVGPGDRVGVVLPKSTESVASIHGILRTGAAYVPIDATAPVGRGANCLADAGVKVAIVAEPLAEPLRFAWPATAPGPQPRRIIVGDHVPKPNDACWREVLNDDAPSPLPPTCLADDAAYILYTSGSTGRPKGVVLSHANAFAFLDWCESHLKPRDDDRFASHAPFHFDLSIFDLYASAQHAAPLILIGESLARDPAKLGEFVSDRRIDVWYSAPSILGLLADYGGIELPDRRAPRLVLFAGEVFPITSLKRLRRLWPDATLWNLYGPTETNVCTAFPIPNIIPDDRSDPYPIGSVCEPHHARVVDESGMDVRPGFVGELWIAGAGVMQGYFGRPDLTSAVIRHDANGTAWYGTGDLVADNGAGVFVFHGRRDRMVKKRGYRIELGEVESALYRHDGVDRAAVIARTDDTGLAIAAFVALKPNHRGSIIAMKRHCTQHLPHYMIPDTITFLPMLPTTSTDKVDYQGLKARVENREIA